jgi:hypothetical protein
MITGVIFPFFARKHSEAPNSRPISARPKKRIMFLRRREATTFEKCLAVHMYYASKPKRFG